MGHPTPSTAFTQRCSQLEQFSPIGVRFGWATRYDCFWPVRDFHGADRNVRNPSQPVVQLDSVNDN